MPFVITVKACLLFFLLSLMPYCSLSAAEEPTIPKKALSKRIKIFKPDKAFPGYTLIPEVGTAKVRLVDFEGNNVTVWPLDAVRARLLKNGNILVIHGTKWGRSQDRWKEMRNKLTEYNPAGQVVWQYTANEVIHHDVWRLANGNTLFLLRSFVPDSLKANLNDPARRIKDIRSDTILEVNPKGKIVWNWHAHEHLDLNDCGRIKCEDRRDISQQPKKMDDWTHTNTSTVIPENKWYRAGHKAFRPGNIVILPRNLHTVMIVERETGKVVWNYAGDYQGGLDASHEAHIIPEDRPGAGNMLIFDNGVNFHPKSSFILEINPVTKALVWVYDVGPKFHSRRRGSVQRLPNGNTLISEDQRNTCFEVTPEKEIVWSYKAPYEVNRCRRYPLDYTSGQ